MATPSDTPIDFSQAMVVDPVPLADWLVIAPVAYCLIAGAALMMMRRSSDTHARIAVPLLGGLVILTAALLWHVATGGTITVTMGRWLPPFGISFTVDILGATFALAASIAALACGIYGNGEMRASSKRYGFYPMLLFIMAGVIGAFVTGDIFNLYVWFEVLLISSFGLQVLGSERSQLDGGMKYAILNLVATTLFLLTTGYLYGIFGTLNMADIAVKAAEMDAAPLLTLAALYFLAFGMKAAAFPVNSWLPASYHTPNIAVSALFAGLLTKVGVYALIRVMIMLFPAQRGELETVIAVVAALTMVLGALGALAQTDVRRLLGYLVISGVGIMMAGIALATPTGLSGSIVYALHSIIVVTALYIAAGAASRIGKSFAMDRLGGLYRSHVFLAALSLILFLSVSGLPPFSGFWPKAMLVQASVEAGAGWLAASVLVSGFLTTIAVGRVWALAYWRPTGIDDAQLPVKLSTGGIYVPLAGLVLLTVWFGLFPQPLIVLAQEAATGLLNPQGYIESVFPATEAIPSVGGAGEGAQ